MTDSVAVFPPGFRLTDSTTGAPISGAVIRFYDAGTTTPKTVYSDLDLTTSLGTSVTTDSLGYPTSNGSTKTLVYVGTASYKITVETAAAVVIATHDNLKGAVQTIDVTDVAVTSVYPVLTKSLAYSVVSADQNTLFRVNCSSANVTLTLPSAVTVGDGWAIKVQHAGSANSAIIATVSSQTITEGSGSLGTSVTMSVLGESVTVVSDGGNWIITDHTSWVALPAATTSVAGAVRFADAAAMEAKTANRGVIADQMHRHPLMAKAWGYVTYSAGVPTLVASHGVSGITDTGTGELTVTWTTAFSSATYGLLPCLADNSGTGIARQKSLSTGSAVIEVRSSTTGANSDPGAISFAAFGDQ